MQSNKWSYEVDGDLVGFEALSLPGALEGLELRAGDIMSLDMRRTRVMDASGLAAWMSRSICDSISRSV